MAIIKCKMCGGTLEITNNETVAVCEYCGTQQTLPKTTDEVTTNLYNRANTLRLKSEFDKAAQTYEKILEVDNTQAEAHWGIILCKYGIEYIEDPATFNRVPTCHRTQLESVMTDADYLAAIEYADATQRAVYEKEAAAIDALQKDILQIVHQEKPFDVFLCYKETDENGKRTPDSVIANDIYYQLTQEGLKVFYAAITLESKLGREYEPYIFAALNSAKVMLVLGTKPEYFSAVWVKNEWSRFMKLMRADRSKLLIPCYRDMDAYDLPEEFAHLQAQDMSKIGFINDVVRGIRKVVVKEEAPKPVAAAAPAPTTQAANTATLLKRALLFLEDGDWTSANEYCEKALDIDPECAEAYLGKLMIDLRVKKQEDLKNCAEPFDGNANYIKVVRFGDEVLRNTLIGTVKHINTRNKEAHLVGTYVRGKKAMDAAVTADNYKEAARLFESISSYKDAAALAAACLEKAEVVHKDEILATAEAKMTGTKIANFEAAVKLLESIPDWKDANEKALACRKTIEELKEKEEVARKKTKKMGILAAALVVVAVAAIVMVTKVVIPNGKYNDAVALMENGQYSEAMAYFEALNGYKNSAEMIVACEDMLFGEMYNNAVAALESGNVDEAIALYLNCGSYRENPDIISAWREKLGDSIAFGMYHTVGLQKDGTVIAIGENSDGQCNVSSWSDVVAVDVDHFNTIGLREDGTVVAAGAGNFGEIGASAWSNIVSVALGVDHAVGLRADGTVVAVGYNDYGQCDVEEWKNIVAISAGTYHTVGLCADGTVVATGANECGQSDVSNWSDIVEINAGAVHTVGLKKDGTVVAVGENSDGQCDVSAWSDIAAVEAGLAHTVGLKSDGTVVAVGWNGFGQCNVGAWTNIVEIASDWLHTAGFSADGTIVAVGDNSYGQCDISGWSNIKVPQ